MKKVLIVLLLGLLLISCSKTKKYYGEDAAFRFFSLKAVPQAMIEENVGTTLIYINSVTETKYECFFTKDKDLSKTVLTVTEGCDVGTELANCLRIEQKREAEKGKRKKTDTKYKHQNIPVDEDY